MDQEGLVSLLQELRRERRNLALAWMFGLLISWGLGFVVGYLTAIKFGVIK